jgi:hypothetical protein
VFRANPRKKKKNLPPFKKKLKQAPQKKSCHDFGVLKEKKPAKVF